MPGSRDESLEEWAAGARPYCYVSHRIVAVGLAGGWPCRACLYAPGAPWLLPLYTDTPDNYVYSDPYTVASAARAAAPAAPPSGGRPEDSLYWGLVRAAAEARRRASLFLAALHGRPIGGPEAYREAVRMLVEETLPWIPVLAASLLGCKPRDAWRYMTVEPGGAGETAIVLGPMPGSDLDRAHRAARRHDRVVYVERINYSLRIVVLVPLPAWKTLKLLENQRREIEYGEKTPEDAVAEALEKAKALQER